MLYLRAVIAPLLILLIFIFFHFLSNSGVIFSINELSVILEEYFMEYGLFAIGILAVIENIIGVNAYFPGSIVILTGMAMTAGDPVLGLLTFFVITICAFAAYNINYFIGKFFANIRQNYSNGNIQSKKTDYEIFAWYFGSFWHPHFAAITCLISGSEGITYRMFLYRAVIVGLFWNIFWALTMYHFGSFSKANLDLTIIMYVYIIGWLFVDTYRFIRR